MIHELKIRSDKARTYKYFLSRFFGKRSNTKLETLIMMAVKRVAAKQAKVDVEMSREKFEEENER